jgi:hypothetical protein
MLVVASVPLPWLMVVALIGNIPTWVMLYLAHTLLLLLLIVCLLIASWE